MKWEPIETAPKDGAKILFYCPNYSGYFGVMAWDSTEWDLCGQVEYDSYDRAGFEPSFNPTHWMRLPEPPTKGK